MRKRILITGGAGFVGHHCIEHLLKNTEWEIIVLDCLSYAGNLNRITDIDVFDPKRVKFVWHDLKAPISETTHKLIDQLDYTIHFAAESHVDRSLQDALPFAISNVVGTTNLLEYVKKYQPNLKKYIGFNCYDKKTRAVTKDGLKKFSELKKGDVVFTLNPKTRKVEEQLIEKIIIQNYEGEMVKFQNQYIDLLVTPNHRMYDEKMNIVKAEEIKQITLPQPEPAGGTKKLIEIGEKKLSLKDLFYLIGVFLGDGFTAYQEKITENKSGLTKKERDKIARESKTGKFVKGKFGELKITKQKSYRIFLDIPENDKTRKKTEKVLENLGIKFTRQKGKAGEHLYFTSKEWLMFFNQFGKGAKNKFIPNWVLKYDATYLRELFNGLIDSDGYWGNLSFSTTSSKLKDGICQLAIKIGLMPNVKERFTKVIFENRIIKGWSYYVNFSKKNKGIDGKQKGKIERVNYEGKIWCIKVKNKNFLVERNGKYTFSGNTDEVFGPAEPGVYHKETDKFYPSNPYAAAKCGQWAMEFAFAHAFGLPICMVHSMNIYGERQDPEKFIPKTIKTLLRGEKVILHGAKGVFSSRKWIHARNVSDALLFLIEKGEKEQTYNVAGEEKNVFEIANLICRIVNGRDLKKDEYEVADAHSQRPGHDLRYSLDDSKMKKLGWIPLLSLEKTFEKMVRWMIKPENKKWLFF